MLNRRQFLGSTGAAALTAIVAPGFSFAAPSADIGRMAMRAIPSSGERLPVIGMGTSGSFEVSAEASARDPLRAVLQRFVAGGGKLIDTAPSYSTAEEVLGDLLEELGMRDKVFLATKLGITGRDEGLAQFNTSLRRLRTDKVELLQVHNLRDWRTQLALARELKAQGKVRYVGLTHYVDSAHEELAAAVRESKPDFLQINYSVTQRAAEETIFPLARELGIAVLTNRNFNDGKLFAAVKDKPVPAWAIEAGADSWAQLFLRFALSDPAVTAVIPATGKPQRQTDNLKAGVETLLDAKQRELLIAEIA